MGKNITVGEGHTTNIKIDHRNGKQTEVENKVEIARGHLYNEGD